MKAEFSSLILHISSFDSGPSSGDWNGLPEKRKNEKKPKQKGLKRTKPR
jgi:hypothetical protein